jgi:hypothetical protein
MPRESEQARLERMISEYETPLWNAGQKVAGIVKALEERNN